MKYICNEYTKMKIYVGGIILTIFSHNCGEKQQFESILNCSEKLILNTLLFEMENKL